MKKYKVDHHIGYREFYDIFGYDEENKPEFIFQTCYLLRNVRFSYAIEYALANPPWHSYELEELSSFTDIADMLQ